MTMRGRSGRKTHRYPWLNRLSSRIESKTIQQGFQDDDPVCPCRTGLLISKTHGLQQDQRSFDVVWCRYKLHIVACCIYTHRLRKASETDGTLADELNSLVSHVRLYVIIRAKVYFRDQSTRIPALG